MEKEEKESTFSKLRENATKFYETTGSPLILQKEGTKCTNLAVLLKMIVSVISF